MRWLVISLLVLSLGVAAYVAAVQSSAPSPAPVKEFTLEAKQAQIELYPGKNVTMWTYNGQVPGPLIRVTQGDHVIIRFYNNHTLPHTIHLHGDHPNAMDGMDMMAVPPGGNFTYEFDAGEAGLYAYHCHVDTPVHIPMGLYGQMLIEPKQGSFGARPDREAFLVFSSWNPHENASAETHMLNGKAFPATQPVQMLAGERLRMYITSFDTEPIAPHFHGTLSQEIWPDVHPTDVMQLAPAESKIVDYVQTQPGVWMFHNHYEMHLRNDGAYPGGSLSAIEVGRERWGGLAHMGHAAHSSSPVGASIPEAASLTPEQLQNATTVRIANYRFDANEIHVKVGQAVVWRNADAVAHTVTSDDAGGALASQLLRPGATFAHVFLAPGTYAYHCEPHSAQDSDGSWAGMTGRVIVE